MRYKLEIIADSVGELMTKTRITFVEVSSDPEFMAQIENKKMGSCFFGKYANILVIDPEDTENDGE